MSSDFPKRSSSTVFIVSAAAVGILLFILVLPAIKKWNFVRFLNHIQNDQAVRNTTLVVGAKYEKEEDFLVAYNQNKRVHPGSTFKLFTAAAALRYMGPDFTFVTKLHRFYDKKGKIHLLIVGSGDPTLKKEHLAQFVDAVKKTGGASGNLYYDDRIFTGEKFGLGWGQDWKNQYFAVPITGLQIDNNLLAIKRIKNGNTRKFIWQTSPLEQYPLSDQIKYAPHEGGYNWSEVTAEMDDSGKVIIKGEADSEAEFSTSSTVRNPSFLTAATLKQEFVKNGIMKPAAQVLSFRENLSGASLLYEHHSKPLGEIVKEMLTYSKNNYAETLVRILGEEIHNKTPRSSTAGSFMRAHSASASKANNPALPVVSRSELINKNQASPLDSQQAGVFVLQEFFKEVGIPESDISAFDGSGLSPSTRVSSRALLGLFEYVNNQKWKDLFWDALPQSQVDGTLKYRFEQAELKHPVIAKTGSHEFSSNLAGKILRGNGKNILFSVHIFNYSFTTQESVQHIIPIIDQIVAMLDKQF